MLRLRRPAVALLLLTLPFAAPAAEANDVLGVGPTDALAAAGTKASVRAEAVEKARVRALAQARRNDESRCAQKKSKQLQDDCRMMIAARYDPAPLIPRGAESALPLAPPVAPPPSLVAPGVRLASATSDPSPPAMTRSFAPVPRDETEGARGRHAEVHNDLQIGPRALVLDHLTAKAEIAPDSLQAGFTYRFALDDSGAAHHLFGASLESARCQNDAGCGLRWFGFAGISPPSAQGFTVQRGGSGKTSLHTDSLGWSANVGAAGVSYLGRLLSFAADGQLEALSMDFDATGGARTSGTLDQLRLRGTAGIAAGPWSGSLRIAGYVYAGAAPETFQLVPLRGALVDDSAGLAGAPQSFQARLEGRCDSSSGFSVAASYGYLSYVGPYWTSANLISAGISQRFGHFRIGLGLVYEAETNRSGATYSTVFGTGTLGASL